MTSQFAAYVRGAYCFKKWSLATFCIVIALLINMPISVAAEIALPELTGRVVDDANILTVADEEAISTELASLEGKSTDQVVVVTVSSLKGLSIEDYGIRLARHWGIGQAGKDNGVLLIVAPVERRVRIEVGRGLEGLMPDALAGLIVTRQILPKFKKGRFAEGITAGVRDINKVLLGDEAEVQSRVKQEPDPMAQYVPYLFMIFWLVPFLYFLNALSEVRRIGGRVPGGIVILPDNYGGGAASDWVSSPGHHRWNDIGGGGGFSGGGGSFGGGGASGSW